MDFQVSDHKISRTAEGFTSKELNVYIYFPGRSVAYAQEDEVDGEEDDIIDDEEVNVDDGTDSEVEQVDGTEEEEEEEELTAKGSPDADTIIYFTKPVGTGSGQCGCQGFVAIF